MPRSLFPPARSSTITFDFQDIQEGTGYNSYYLVNTTDQNLLSTQQIYSDMVETEAMITTSGFLKTLDLDFDVEFNLPKIVKGTGMCSCALGVAQTGSNSTHNIYVIVKARHWDGSSETDLVSNQSDTWVVSTTGTGVGDFKYTTLTPDLIIPATHFKKGETLRITVEVWAKSNAGNDAHVFLGHDPQNRAKTDRDPYTFGTEPSVSIATIPFKIDIS